jgi:hypothetical protein
LRFEEPIKRVPSTRYAAATALLDRIGRKMQIERLRRPTVKAVQKRRCGVVARRIRVVVLRKFDQGVDRQARILAGLDHDVGNFPIDLTPRLLLQAALWRRRIFRQTRRIPLWPFLNHPLPVRLPRTF